MRFFISIISIILFCNTILFSQDTESGIVAHWDFDHIQNGYVKDNSANKLDLIIKGNPKVVKGVMGNGMFFDGVDDYLHIPMPKELYFDKDSSMTISLWARPISAVDNDGSGAGCILNGIPLLCSYRYMLRNRGIKLKLYNSGKDVNAYYSKDQDTNSYHFFTAVLYFSNGNYCLETYYDGCLKDSNKMSYNNNLSYRYEGLYIAATHHCNVNLNYARTYLDDIRIYNRALSALDIAKLYTDGGGVLEHELDIDRKEIDLGKVPCNIDTAFTLKFFNPGEGETKVFDITATGNEDEINISNKEFTVEPGEEKIISIDYKPLGQDQIRDTLFVLTEGLCDSIIVPIYILAEIEKMNVEIDVTKTGFCKGDSAILKASGNYEYYEWHKEGETGVIGIKNEFKTTESGKYYVIVRDENGCEGISDIIEITFSDMENGLEISGLSSSGVMEFDSTYFPEKLCKDIRIKNIADEDLTLYDVLVINNIQFSVPQAQFPLVLKAGGTYDLKVCYSPLELGEARDTLVIEDFCSTWYIPLWGFCPKNIREGDSRCDVKTQVVTSELPQKGFFSASPPVPNPSSGIIEVDYVKSNDSDINCSVANTLGIKCSEEFISISEQKETESISSGKIRIDLSNYPGGVYYINITNGDKVISYSVPLYK